MMDFPPGGKLDQFTGGAMRFVFAESTYAGSSEHPDHNEDATLILGDSRTAAVFDGLGGGDRGEEASGIAREVFAQMLRKLPPDLTEEEAIAVLYRTFREADGAIAFHARQTRAFGMGTTATAVLLVEGDAHDAWRAVVGSVADSRAYLLRGGRLGVVTVDNVSDSTPEVAIEERRRLQKKIAEAERADDLLDVYELLFAHRQVHEPLGDGSVDPRIIVTVIQPGDRILLTTDGIHDNLTTAEIAALLDDPDAEMAAAALISAARERSLSDHFRAKPDDMSVVVIYTAP